ncbi:MAG: hypothetical protein PF505_08135 [Vallitaleaceae bacterium]|nr:hypothetical protein [Vallitaleaceae bacterium]
MKKTKTTLRTTLGELTREQVGFILPHEHVFVDLRPMDVPGFGEADASDVKQLMVPYIEEAKAKGVSMMVDCGPLGVGRRVDIIKAVSKAAKLPIMVPTGIYREPWVPKWVYGASEMEIAEWMTRELTEGIENTGVKAGFIKLSAGDSGITDIERKILKAACISAKLVNAVIGSHTIHGEVVRNQLDIIEEMGYKADRFIWIHTHLERNFDIHLEMLRRGAWIEYDGISWEDDERFIELILKVINAGYIDQLLLSQDNGWYSPKTGLASKVRGYTYLGDIFIPKLKAAGVDEASIIKLTQINPFNAFAR